MTLTWDGRGVACSGFSAAYSFRSSSHRANLSCRSWLGRRRLRAGAGVLGVHLTFALGGCQQAQHPPTRPRHLTLIQLAQGKTLSHLIFRCWQRTQARMRWGLLGANGAFRGLGVVDEDAMAGRGG